MAEIEKYLQDVLDDYHTCIDRECENCKADQKIFPSGNTTFCQFLLEHRHYVENELIKAIDKAL